jgi:chemotaxis protein methyltransferase CheR
MRRAHGLDLARYDESFLAQVIEKRQAAAADATAGDYAARLSADRAEAEALSRALLITYSEFFRNPLACAVLEQLVLPGLRQVCQKERRAELRIWSAGCAAGQEAYSVAILLEELSVASLEEVPYRVFATDLSEPDLAAARSGAFGELAMGNVRLRHMAAHFLKSGESYAIAPRIRDRVDFSLYDLLDPRTTCPPASVYGDFDLVLCSNVLFYYRPDAQAFILDKVRQCLTPHGCLVTGEVERRVVTGAGGFRQVANPAPVFFKAED